MYHMNLISHNFDDGSINIADPRIIAVETSQKDNLHLDEATKADYCEDFIKATGKEIKYLTTEDSWEILPKSSTTTSSHIIRIIWIFKRKINLFREYIKQGKSNIFYIETNEQQYDIITKPLAKPQFDNLRKQIMGW